LSTLASFDIPHLCFVIFGIDTDEAFCNEGFGLDGLSSNLNRKKLWTGKNSSSHSFAAFGFMFVFGFIWYAKLMHGAHSEVPVLWRSEAEFGSHFSWLVFGHILMAFFLTLLCSKFVPEGGPGPCARLGILLALVYVGNDFITYAVQPLTTKILCGWIVGALIQFGVAGAIIGAIHKSSSPVAR
jgi:hypothetical protein